MSNDLISRSAVIDVIKRHECDTSRIMGGGVMDLPIAYDVDKVLEQLEEERNPMYRADGSLMSERRLIEIDKAVEIVKSGGIAEEKNTEWKEHFASRFGRIE